MGRASEISERLWAGTASTSELGPVALTLGLEDYADGVAFLSSFGNLTLVETADGLVLIDTGSFFLAAQNFATIRRHTQSALRHAVYTHGHVDHAFGMPPFDAEAKEAGRPLPEVIAHQAVVERFERYQLTAGYNRAINARQFGVSAWPSEYRFPDRTFAQRLDLTVGGERIELRHARGETDDSVWAWLPERKLLCTGDLFIWASPNCGNPQKVPRYPRDWARALREMSALGAERLFPGHGPPIDGRDRVEQALSETADLLEFLVRETLERMNAGMRLDRILGEVRAPERLLERPYLRPVYDEPEFIVRNLWRLYGGWWDGNPATLKPAREAELGSEIARLAGGAETLARRAEALAAGGELALAAHLVELARAARPDDASIAKIRAAIYAARSASETSLMAKNIFRAAAEET
jgi:alkyl sulfatase BDS1-like metallo-beta-lactamase superfamily hydrolase